LIATYTPPIEPAQSLIGPDVCRFLNVERRCNSPSDWNAADVTQLWTFNLHYFDDLNARDASSRTEWHRLWIERWVKENPPGVGAGWGPYPLSRRIVNWVKWVCRGNVLPVSCYESLAIQTRWLMDCIEYHILGNHLFTNAKALVHAGLFCDGPEAQRWFDRGFAILERQIQEQILADGGHFELSPMYHAAILEDMLDLVNVLSAFGRTTPRVWLDSITRMQKWLKSMTHADGRIAFFNDAAFGIAPESGELDAYAVRLGLPTLESARVPLVALNPSGYLRANKGDALLICDCASVGPDYQPGHAHADTLSFELSFGNQRVFVNSGTSVYGNDEERQRQRGTRAHNTIVVDGLNSSEVWAGFRVARRARVKLLSATSNRDNQSVVIEATHDGYRHLRGSAEHRRRWTLTEGALRIDDSLNGRFRNAEAYLHTHPIVAVQRVGPRQVNLSWPNGGRLAVSFDDAAEVRIEASTWHPEFGVSNANRCIAVRLTGNSLVTRMSWPRP
jgi:uncharacterized heparinase superfamily protein